MEYLPGDGKLSEPTSRPHPASDLKSEILCSLHFKFMIFLETLGKSSSGGVWLVRDTSQKWDCLCLMRDKIHIFSGYHWIWVSLWLSHGLNN